MEIVPLDEICSNPVSNSLYGTCKIVNHHTQKIIFRLFRGNFFFFFFKEVTKGYQSIALGEICSNMMLIAHFYQNFLIYHPKTTSKRPHNIPPRRVNPTEIVLSTNPTCVFSELALFVDFISHSYCPIWLFQGLFQDLSLHSW